LIRRFCVFILYSLLTDISANYFPARGQTATILNMGDCDRLKYPEYSKKKCVQNNTKENSWTRGCEYTENGRVIWNWILWKCLMFMGPCIVNVCFKYNQQDVTSYNILYYCQCTTCFRRFLRPSSGAQKLYKQHRLAHPTTYTNQIHLTHASGSSKKVWHTPDDACVQFLSSWWWAEKPPETCRVLTIIKYIV